MRAALTDDTRGAVNDQPLDTPQPLWVRFAPGDPVLKGVNWGGLKTLYIKEVRRFFKVQMQTVWAPAVTTLLYLAIFTVAIVPFTDISVPTSRLGAFGAGLSSSSGAADGSGVASITGAGEGAKDATGSGEPVAAGAGCCCARACAGAVARTRAATTASAG